MFTVVIFCSFTRASLNGSVFDSSEGRDPLEFKIGDGNIIPGSGTGRPGILVAGHTAVIVAAGLTAYTIV
ncbi:MAG: FKBP-type peptidyl-prolyl cis-trans isomerase [Desulfobacteraceae bacterium]|nr:FKBP-type peptidyl-prolyl cis-trans isomerase [Desulfobacteraceae bacterium]